MGKAVLCISLDEDIKCEFETLCAKLELSVENAIAMFIERMTQEQEFPFELTVNPFYSPENQCVLQQSINQINAGHASKHELLDDE